MKAWREIRLGRGAGGRRKVERIVASVGAIVVNCSVARESWLRPRNTRSRKYKSSGVLS